jgi:phage tail sheath gpL-like
MSGSIAFSRIPANNLVPLFYVEFSNVNAGVTSNQKPSLLIGQYTPPSSGAPAPSVPVFIASPTVARSLFGARSMLGRMCSTYLTQDVSGLWCVPVPDAAGSAAAVGTLTVTGTATGPGAVPLYIAGLSIPVGVFVGDTPTVIAADIVAAVNATLDLPVVATASAGVVTLTAAHKGAQGNNIDIRLAYLGPQAGEVLPAGVSIAISPMAGGTIDPDMAFLAAALGDAPYDFTGHPFSTAADLTEFTTLMNDASGRWAPTRQVYGHVYTMQPGTLSSEMTTGASINDQHQTIIGVRGSPSPPWDWVADWLGAAAVSVRNNPRQPLQTLPLLTVKPPAQASWWIYAEKQALLTAGISYPEFNTAGQVFIGRSVTTYKTNAFGVTDASYQADTTMFTLMEITRRLKNATVTKFSRNTVVVNGTPVGPASIAITPNDVLAEIAVVYAGCEDDGLVDDAAYMLANTIVQQNANNPGRVDVLWTPALANELTMVAVVNQFTLNPPGPL